MANYATALQPWDRGTRIAVRVVPRAPRTELVGLHGPELKIRLHAPPVEGKANAAVVRYLAEVLGVSTSQVVLLGGERSRSKSVGVTGMSPADVAARLASL